MNSTSSPKRVLFVAYQFPPVGGVGVHRVVKFVKYLPEFGWEASVLTVSNPSVPLTDHSLLADIPESTPIVRAPTWEPSYRWKQKLAGASRPTPQPQQAAQSAPKKSSLLKRLARGAANTLLQPDLQRLWGPQAFRKGSQLLRQLPHEAVIATAPPFSSFLVGARLAQRFHLPLLLDYRDEWGISNTYWENKQQSRFSRWLQQRMQARVLRAAQMAIATTPSSCRSVQETAEAAQADIDCDYIYNGYDPDDFKLHSSDLNRRDYGNGTEKFRLSYVGTLWNLNSIEPLVTALQKLGQTSPQLLEQLEFVVAGRRTPDQEMLLNRIESLPCSLVKLPFLSHDEAITLMQTSDCLALLNAAAPGAERIINGKIFEYLACRKPFLLISPRGDMWDLTQDCPLAIPCPPDQTETIAGQLAHQLERHIQHLPVETGNWQPEMHERRARAEQLAQFLDQMVGKTRSRHTPSHTFQAPVNS